MSALARFMFYCLEQSTDSWGAYKRRQEDNAKAVAELLIAGDY